MVAIVLFLSLFAFLIFNVPVGIAIGLSSLAAIVTGGTMSNTFLVQQMIAGSDSFTLMAIPLFILA